MDTYIELCFLLSDLEEAHLSSNEPSIVDASSIEWDDILADAEMTGGSGRVYCIIC